MRRWCTDGKRQRCELNFAERQQNRGRALKTKTKEDEKNTRLADDCECVHECRTKSIVQNNFIMIYTIEEKGGKGEGEDDNPRKEA